MVDSTGSGVGAFGGDLVSRFPWASLPDCKSDFAQNMPVLASLICWTFLGGIGCRATNSCDRWRMGCHVGFTGFCLVLVVIYGDFVGLFVGLFLGCRSQPGMRFRRLWQLEHRHSFFRGLKTRRRLLHRMPGWELFCLFRLF